MEALTSSRKLIPDVVIPSIRRREQTGASSDEQTMKGSLRNRKNELGFSLMEVLIAMVIFGILAAIAIPAFSGWLPNYNLKAAARDLYSDFQLAKLTAIKRNTACALVFDAAVTPGRYFVCSEPGANGTWDGPPEMGGDDLVIKAANLSDYGNYMSFGAANTGDDIPGSGSPPADPVTYSAPTDIAIFSLSGMVVNPGAAGAYIYLSNNQGSSYGVETPGSAGVIVLRRWNGAAWD